ncbi:hypothetical protein [Streptococcus pneumoniae]|uniref:hypothetical protein n=1 Tax=Streptococcus pneumoniae TaxID=1313 RepID=UPI0006DD044E|nr:hypothetical protein [Streptococcus pneumoniae]
MKIKDKTRKLAVGCSKHCFLKLTKSVTIHMVEATLTWFETHGKATLTWFEEIFEEYYISKGRSKFTPTC